jgi:hypothetical protein
VARLPNFALARIGIEKPTGHVLNPGHRHGGGKTRAFARVLGYVIVTARELADAIRHGLASAEAAVGLIDRFGTRYTLDIRVAGPAGTAIVRTGWIVERGAQEPRLVTAYVR